MCTSALVSLQPGLEPVTELSYGGFTMGVGDLTHLTVASVLLCCTGGCQLLGYFDQVPPDRCDVSGRQEQLPCGPCLKGLQLRVCGENNLWRREGACLDNPYDIDQDGYANPFCFEEEDEECCGEPDCDDATAERYPGHGDVDRDEHIDVRCGGDDCDDDNDDLWNGHADRDDDGHDDVRCGGDDCDDDNDERWNGHADVDGDGHTDLHCCMSDTPLCDDCNDDDPLRWLNHADLDLDGHDDMSCCDVDGACGDDCDDMHPRRWMGHADVDGDGRVDDRCCPGCETERLDCNDNDPSRWTGNSDLDLDGFEDILCRCGRAPDIDCSQHADCDDDCNTCHPGAERTFGDARDHDCDWVIDDLAVSSCTPGDIQVVGSVDTGDSQSVFVTGELVYVASSDGLYVVNVTNAEQPSISSHLDVGSARDLAVHGDYVYVATPSGLVVVEHSSSSGLVRLAGPLDTGDTRAVYHMGFNVFVASHDGVRVLDISSPRFPMEIAFIGPPVIHDARDISASHSRVRVVSHHDTMGEEDGLIVLSYLLGQLDLLSHVPIEGATTLARVWGVHEMYVATEQEILYLSGTDFPVVTGRYDMANVTAMRSADRFLVYVTSADGLFVLDYNMRPLHFEPHGPAQDVMVRGEHGYLATPSGLSVFSLGCAE